MSPPKEAPNQDDSVLIDNSNHGSPKVTTLSDNDEFDVLKSRPRKVPRFKWKMYLRKMMRKHWTSATLK